MLHATLAKATVSECKMVWRIRNHTCTEVPKLHIHSSYSHILIKYTAMLNLYTPMNSTTVAPTS